MLDDQEVAGMDLDTSSDISSSEHVASELTPSKRPNGNAHHQSTTNDTLGSSISRSARMRATTTEDEGGSGSEEEGDSSDGEGTQATLTNFAKTTSSGSFVTASHGEAYLQAMSRPAKTSNKKLSESWNSGRPFTQASYLNLLRKSGTSKRKKRLEAKIHQLENAYQALHEQWAFELQQGFSIFFYGLGSKIRVLESFVKDFLHKKQRARGKVVIINGFMATLGVDDILSALEGILYTGSTNDAQPASLGKSAAKLDERAWLLIKSLDDSTSRFSRERPIYLVIHNIDGLTLRSFRAQAILSLLASRPQIKVMASIDHVKASLFFPSAIASARPTPTGDSIVQGYNAIYHHIPTHRPYTAETILSGTMGTILPPSLFISDMTFGSGAQDGMAHASSESRAKAAFFVLASLTQKSKDVFILLAERQISLLSPSSSSKSTSLNPDRTPSHATLYGNLFLLARDRFLANNTNQFEALLREFRDHNVMLSSRNRPADVEEDDADEGEREDLGVRNGEWVWIGIDKEDLENLLERLKS